MSGLEILISEHLFEIMFQKASEHFPKEFGGILTGVMFPELWIVTDVQTPTKYKNSITNFTREVQSLNIYLQQAYRQSKGKIHYLGEWHTHPKMSGQFSSDDKKSMLEIASDSKVTISAPMLIILSTEQTKYSYNAYQITNNNLIILNKKYNE